MTEEIPICECGKNPSLNESDFDFTYSEYGMLDKILSYEHTAICKECGDVFKIKKEASYQ